MATNPRPIASLTISFGLVAIPVSVYSSTVASEKFSFNFLRAKDGSRVKQQYIAVKDGKIVPRSEIAKGYEFSKGQFVMFSPEELKELEDESSRAIDIKEFAPLQSVDPKYFSGTYLLAPEKGGAKPYALLTKALVQSELCAIGRWVSHGKEHIVVIRPMEGGLVMHQLHFQAELRSVDDLDIERSNVNEAELKLARQLVEHLAVKKFDAEEFKDEYKDRLKAAVKRKIDGKDISLSELAPEPRGDNVIDLMQALKKSLSARAAADEGRRTPKRADSDEKRKAAKH